MRYIVSLFVLFFAVTASAQNSASARVDVREGAQPYVMYTATINGWQVYAFDAHNVPEWQVGRELKAAKIGAHTVSLSGYAAYQPEGKVSVIPWLHARGPISALKAFYVFNFASYVPLNGGRHFTFSDDSNVMWKLTERVSLGVSGTYKHFDDGSTNAGVGPKVSLQLRKGLKVHFRYVAMQKGGGVFRTNPVGSF